MKNFIILCGILLLSFATYGQAQPKESLPTEETTQIVNNVMDRMEKGISTLAEKLKTPAEHVYSVLVQQQIITGLVLIILDSLFLVLFVIFLLGHKKSYNIYLNKNSTASSRYDFALQDTYQTYAGLAIALGAIWISLFIAFIIAGLPRFFNPEYYAIDKILTLIK